MTVKVSEGAADRSLGNLLPNTTFLELGDHIGLFDVLGNNGGTRSTGQRLHNELGQGEALQGNNLTLDTGGGSVNEGLSCAHSKNDKRSDKHTRLWSTISTITATLSLSSPKLIRTRRPTCTNLVKTYSSKDAA